MLDKNKKEILRRIRWLNKISDKPTEYTLCVEAPSDARFAIIGYRINIEEAIPSNWTGYIQAIKEISCEISTCKEDFDNFMSHVNVSKNQVLGINSIQFPVIPGKKYAVETTFLGIDGHPYSAYFTMIFLDKRGREILRRIRWLNNFSDEPLSYNIVSIVPEEAEHAVCAYRINTEGTLTSDWSGFLSNIETICLKEVSSEIEEIWDDLLDSHRARAKNMRDLTSDEEEQIERNMIWILGSPRSGSSWLGTQLLCHKDIVSLNEPLIGAHLSILETEVWHMLNPPKHGNLIELRRTIDVHKNEPDYIFCDAYKDVWIPFLRKMIIHRINAQFPDAINKRIIIKEPNGSMASDIIMQIFSKSKLMFLVRDGRDIIDSKIDLYRDNSWVKKWITPPPLTEQRRRWVIISESNIWKNLTEITLKAFKNHPQSLRLLIRYEDLRMNTTDVLKEIYKFLEIYVDERYINNIADKYSFDKMPEDMKGEGKVVRRAKPGGWKVSFSLEEKEIMNSIMGDFLKAFGYEV